MERLSFVIIMVLFHSLGFAVTLTPAEIETQKSAQERCIEQRIKECLDVCQVTAQTDCVQRCEENAAGECRQAGE